MINVLFVTSNCEDYLSDALLHGFKTCGLAQVVDYPKSISLYKGAVELAQIRGHGFTLFGLLEEDSVNRYGIVDRVRRSQFDLIVFSSIHRQLGALLELLPVLGKTNVAVVDGEDSAAIFPYRGDYWRNPYLWFLPRVHKMFSYYKREWTAETMRYRCYKLLPKFICDHLPPPANLKRIAFSIPKEKIIKALPEKTKMFPKHIVDSEVASRVPGSSAKYAFLEEKDYYADLQSSRFGITTRRSGWDCLRHYEIAANGAVPCFRDLDKKPTTCAPHGLDSSNSISYSSCEDLFRQIAQLSAKDYSRLQNGAWQWAKQNTTVARAIDVLQDAGVACRD
jgi:hypothetical protein